MKFCSDCGGALEDRVPPGDDRERRWCPTCEKAHYVNPLVVVGCVVEHDDKVLLCRRAIEPAHGKWTIPAGFLELAETTEQGAVRETREEAGADVEVIAPHSHLELTHIGQLHLTFRARMRNDHFEPGIESLECAFFGEDDLPWADLAFPAGHYALRLLFDDRRREQPHMHHGQLKWNGEGSRFNPHNYVIDRHRLTPIG